MTMRKLLLTTWLFSITCTEQLISLSGKEGGKAEINCPYASGYETYPKYFYKGIYAYRKVVIHVKNGKIESTDRSKYNLKDDTRQRILHVTIHNLRAEDAGTYWCLIDAYGFDPVTEIQLKVYNAPSPTKPSKPPGSTTFQSTTKTTQRPRTSAVPDRTTSAPLWSTPTEDTHTVTSLPVLSALAGKQMLLGAAAVAAVLLLSVFLFFYFKLRKQRHDKARAGRAAYTYSAHSQAQLRDPEPSVGLESSFCVYTVVAARRRQTVTVQAPPVSPGSVGPCPQDDSSTSQREVEGRNEDVHLLYSRICFDTKKAALQPRVQITSSAGPADLYATVKHPQT